MEIYILIVGGKEYVNDVENFMVTSSLDEVNREFDKRLELSKKYNPGDRFVESFKLYEDDDHVLRYADDECLWGNYIKIEKWIT